MKVRCKVNHYREWIVKEESTSFYIAYDGDSDPMALPKADYEPVEEWVDVTAQCTIETDGHGRYSLFHKNKAVFVDDCKYRVTPNGAVVYKVERKR